MATQAQYVSQMIAQLRALDPSISAEPGTPERKIIETVAQAMAEAQVDIAATSAPFDIDSKYGTDIDKLISLFGYGRQGGTKARGYVTFSRNAAMDKDIMIPAGVQLMGPKPTAGGYNVMFVTLSSVVLAKGTTSVMAPIECATVGVDGNAAAGSIISWVGTPTYGVTNVTNEAPTYGGSDPEGDNELKVRFKNTVFRNLSGTTDQFLALAIAAANVTQANVIGPVSTYKEKIQVPAKDDSINGGGFANQYTTNISANKNIAHFYENLQSYILKDTTAGESFYTPDTDYQVNYPPLKYGDSSTNTITTRPNVTFKIPADAKARSVVPGETVIFEYSYISNASRNNYEKKILNCVDVFIDAQKPSLANVSIPIPSKAFTTNAASPLYISKYRRIGDAARTPSSGNYFTPLFQQPVTDLPDTISVSYSVSSTETTYTYYKGIHYWGVEDWTENRGTTRARNGIEWSSTIKGQSGKEDYYSGPTINNVAASSITVNQYTYDQNVQDVQASAQSNKQVTTDVLVHGAKVRYFKPDITVAYNNGVDPTNINNLIKNNLDVYFRNVSFGSYVQLSDILQVVHNTPGVDNVDWTYNQAKTALSDDGGTSSTKLPLISVREPFYAYKMRETNKLGDPLARFVIEPTSPTSLKAYYTLPSDSPYFNVTSGKQTYNNNAFILGYRSGLVEKTSTILSSILFFNSFNFTVGTNVSTTPQIDSTTVYRKWDNKNLGSGTNSNSLIFAINGLLGTQGTVNIYSISQGGLSTGSGTYPTENNPMIITGTGLPFNGSGILDFSANLTIQSYIKSDWDYDSDISLGDNEIARLPDVVTNTDGTTDISSAITIRQKTQNTWGH